MNASQLKSYLFSIFCTLPFIEHMRQTYIELDDCFLLCGFGYFCCCSQMTAFPCTCHLDPLTGDTRVWIWDLLHIYSSMCQDKPLCSGYIKLIFMKDNIFKSLMHFCYTNLEIFLNLGRLRQMPSNLIIGVESQYEDFLTTDKHYCWLSAKQSNDGDMMLCR